MTMKDWTCTQRCSALRGITASLLVWTSLATAGPLASQTDYYNTDRYRPVRVEDAYATETYALEVKLAPLRLERSSGGSYHWGLDPEIAYGVLPRTSIEMGLPFGISEGIDGETSVGFEGMSLSVFHNLNVETRTLPAFGLRGDLSLPVGNRGSDRVRPSLTLLATRTFPALRVHLNALVTPGGVEDAEHGTAGAHETPRWLVGVAADRVFPLDALLLTSSVHASAGFAADAPVEWHTEAGARYQISPYLALDAGVGRRFTGETGWYLTFGSALHIGVRSLIRQAR